MAYQYVAKGNYGSVHFIPSKHPRQWLMEYYGTTSARKIYSDPDATHVGWIIGGQWFEVYKLADLK